jgi:hypothetical protein
MPIIDLQRRMRQLGEIRLGHTVDTGKISKKTGKPILRPEKLDKFRFTSASKPLLEQIAELYGGTVQPWTPANGGPTEWEVYSQVDRVPVIVPPMNNVIDSWYEQYKGSKCVRRCDGRIEQKSDQACMCDPAKRECQITTRLNVMLRDVRGLGVWLLTTHGYYATTELPAMAEALLRARGEVPGFLTMEEKTVPLEEGGTARFMVPKLDVDLSPGQLFAGAAPTVAVNGTERPAVEGGRPELPAGPARDFVADIRAATTRDDVIAVWRAAKDARNPNAAEVEAAAKARVAELDESEQSPQDRMDAADFMRAAEQATTKAGLTEVLSRAQAAGFATDLADTEDEVVQVFLARLRTLDGATEPAPDVESDRDAVWSQIVAVWPGDRVSEIEAEFAEQTGGVPVADASGEQLAAFLAGVKSGAIKPAEQGSAVPF